CFCEEPDRGFVVATASEQAFDRDRTVEHLLQCQIDLAETATTDLLSHFIAQALDRLGERGVRALPRGLTRRGADGLLRFVVPGERLLPQLLNRIICAAGAGDHSPSRETPCHQCAENRRSRCAATFGRP